MKKGLIAIIALIMFLVGCGSGQNATVNGDVNVDTDINADPAFEITVYDESKAYNGTTIFADNHIPNEPRIVEVNMYGETVWEYVVPKELAQYDNPGLDVEKLDNGNVLFILPANGIYEVDREGETVWSYLDGKISHDVDRLPNGNTLVVFGNKDTYKDAQVKEISPEGEIVWSWYANSCFKGEEYVSIFNDGWTHANAAERLDNGNTLISLRNFNLIAEVDGEGNLIRTIGEGILEEQHDPKMEKNGNILLANQATPHAALVLNPDTNEIDWKFAIEEHSSWPVRGADRLPNGNVLITEADRLVEVTVDKEIVWELVLKDPIEKGEGSAIGLFTSQRVGE